MGELRAWKYRLYPSKSQQKKLESYLYSCKELWNNILEHAKNHYTETGKFPTRKQLYLLAKETPLFSQVAQNVADRLAKSLLSMIGRKKSGVKAGFPRFKSIERVKSFTYPQFGFRLGEKLELSGIGGIAIRKHRDLEGKTKTLTIKKSPSGKWFAIFTSEVERKVHGQKPGTGAAVGLDLGVEHFAHLSNGEIIENPRHLKDAEQHLAEVQRRLSKKKKGSKNRRKARLKVAIAHEKVADRRRDFLHKVSRMLAKKYSFIAMEDLNVSGLSRGFLAKEVLDCSWAEFSNMLAYKAEEAGCKIVLVDSANTTKECSSCGLVRKKSLAERWHHCLCGASMPRDLNAAINILNRATSGTGGSQACLRRSLYPQGQASSMKQEAQRFSAG